MGIAKVNCQSNLPPLLEHVYIELVSRRSANDVFSRLGKYIAMNSPSLVLHRACLRTAHIHLTLNPRHALLITIERDYVELLHPSLVL